MAYEGLENMDRRIKVNKAQCRNCGAVLESTYTHDYKTCECPSSIMVDGGKSYLRRGHAVGCENDFIELSEYYDDEAPV